MCPSSVQAFIEEELAPELLDFTEELLLESVDGLDFAEEDEMLLQDEGLDPSWLSPLRMTLSLLSLLPLLLDPFDSACASLRVTPEEESSPQAVRLIVAIRARTGREKNFMSRGG